MFHVRGWTCYKSRSSSINKWEEEKGREKEGERDLWTTRSEIETSQDLDRRLSFMLAEEPIKVEQANAVPRFRNA